MFLFLAERQKYMDTIKCRAKEEQKDKEQDLKYKGIQASVGRFFLGFVNFF